MNSPLVNKKNDKTHNYIVHNSLLQPPSPGPAPPPTPPVASSGQCPTPAYAPPPAPAPAPAAAPGAPAPPDQPAPPDESPGNMTGHYELSKFQSHLDLLVPVVVDGRFLLKIVILLRVREGCGGKNPKCKLFSKRGGGVKPQVYIYKKNPAYGRHQLSRPMQMEEPIQI